MRKNTPLLLAVLLASPLALRADKPAPKPARPAAPTEAPSAPVRADDPDEVFDDEADEIADEDNPFAKLDFKAGPQKIAMGNDLTLDLPAGFAFLDKTEAPKFIALTKNVTGPNTLGVVLKADGNWWVEVTYDADGYVKDDDADKLDADAILESYKEGTEESNAERAKLGGTPIHVTGWAEKPRYEKAVHHVVWALTVGGEKGDSVNFNTRVLGRKGVASLNLICSPADLATAKADVATLLGATTFDMGARYEDFKQGDKVADYGLAALVLGGAGAAALKLAKVGFFAKMFPALAKGCAAGAKPIIALLVALGAGLSRLFGRKKNEG